MQKQFSTGFATLVLLAVAIVFDGNGGPFAGDRTGDLGGGVTSERRDPSGGEAAPGQPGASTEVSDGQPEDPWGAFEIGSGDPVAGFDEYSAEPGPLTVTRPGIVVPAPRKGTIPDAAPVL